jgi:predicted enzyme related to lactoylglutathione lyase
MPHAVKPANPVGWFEIYVQDVSIYQPKMPIGPNGFIALVVDTEGNLVGLHSTK